MKARFWLFDPSYARYRQSRNLQRHLWQHQLHCLLRIEHLYVSLWTRYTYMYIHIHIMLKWCHGLVWTRLNWLLDMVYKGLHLGIISCCCHLRKHLFCCKKGRKYVSGGDLRAYKENTSRRWLICFFCCFIVFAFSPYLWCTHIIVTQLSQTLIPYCVKHFLLFFIVLYKRRKSAMMMKYMYHYLWLIVI